MPSRDPAELEATLVLARRALEMEKDGPYLMHFKLCEGLAAYRSGQFEKADAALAIAMERGKDVPVFAVTISFYRAMALFRLGKTEEARRIAIAAAIKMTPLPADDSSLADVDHDQLIQWLAYKEMRATLALDRTPIELLEIELDKAVKLHGANHSSVLTMTRDLADAYVSSGRTRDAVPLLAILSAANPKDVATSLKVAALQAWFGQENELAVTRSRMLELTRSDDTMAPDQAVKAFCIVPVSDKAGLDSALTLIRAAVNNTNGRTSANLLALGMAERRAGNFAAAESALLDATNAKPSDVIVARIAAFHRSMALFQLAQREEARKLAVDTALGMKPLPEDAKNPLSGGATPDDVITWLAYKEARDLVQFDKPAQPPVEIAPLPREK
jgi:tetratricopeptide (TPR) repeat protein